MTFVRILLDANTSPNVGLAAKFAIILRKMTRYLLLALVLVSSLSAQEVFTPEHVAKLRTVLSAEISPNGEQIAYVLNVPRIPFEGDDGGAWRELHVVDREGNSRAFVTGKVSVSGITWRPDSSEILFLSRRGDDENTTLYSIPVDGGEATQLFSHATSIDSCDLDASGNKLAFIADETAPKADETLTEAGFSQRVFEESWAHSKVWIVDLSADEPKAEMLDLEGSAHAVEWNPQGTRLAVSLSPTPSVDDSYMNIELVYVDPVNGEIHGGYSPPGKMDSFQWSPDGNRMAIIGTLDRSDPAAGRLLIASVESGEAHDLMPGLDAHVSNIEWTAIDNVAYIAGQGVWSRLGSVRLDGSGTTAIQADDSSVFTGFSHANDGTVALLQQSSQHPSEVAVVIDGKLKRLTDSNPWLADMRFAKQERIEYKSRDGLTLEGILIHPLDEQPGQRYPLILYVHGGPEAHEVDGWLTSYSRPGQVAAARGFAVFHPNYRASTGRGVEFSKLDHGDFAGKEFDDLVDAITHFDNAGLVDPEKVGITGGSYGGYATAWASTALTEHFAAGVMFVGISDQISKLGSTDIPVEVFEVHHRKHLWDDWQFFLERSPIFHAGKAKTPLLILHGEEDTRVPTDQSLELYRMIKLQTDTPVRLVLYPGEGHGNRRAASRYDYNLRMLRWMEHYLQGPGGDPPPYRPNYVKPADNDSVNP
jgi:dipeptidyl aminopeptidase/acylaminoacyl peptidase